MLRAMILAAGRGERMRPLTDTVPKPLLRVRGKPLIVHHLEKLARLGVREVVINLSWLGERLRDQIGDGAQWGLAIRYSEEGSAALETGGGILRALPWLGPEPFLVVNGDVYTDFDFRQLHLPGNLLAQLVLVPNPDFHPRGDFLLEDGLIGEPAAPGAGRSWTFSGIGLYRPALFEGCSPGRFPLLPVLRRAIAERRLGGLIHVGQWSGVDTPDRLAALQ